MPRILGLDYGERRLGFAVSDETQIIATPLRVEPVSCVDDALRAVAGVCSETRAVLLVVGLPLNMDGSRGPKAQEVLSFIEKLAPRLGIPVRTWDERLTTKSAENVLIEAGSSRRRRREVVDKLAAQILLQSYLDCIAFQDEENNHDGR